MKLGYNCWGFLGKGIVDTPDGGRSHRYTLIRGLISAGCSVIMLQKNRDLEEAGEDYRHTGVTFNSSGFPEIDALFLEYRWPISGRNVDIPKTNPDYTPDYDRQQQLISFYTNKRIPILIWDKDQKLIFDPLSDYPWHTTFEAAFKPNPGRLRLLFPADSTRTDDAKRKIAKYQVNSKQSDLVYVGNQYERDESFLKYYDKASQIMKQRVDIYGKWQHFAALQTSSGIFPYLNLKGRVHYDETAPIYENSLTTVLIAPPRYYKSGQYTQRIFEALWGLCIPLVPVEYSCKDLLFPPELVVSDGQDVVNKIVWIKSLLPDRWRTILLYLLDRLSEFSTDKQVETIMSNIIALQKTHARKS